MTYHAVPVDSQNDQEAPLCKSEGELPGTIDAILDQINLKNRFALFVSVSMAFLWQLSVMPMLVPAYLAPNGNCTNCSFVGVQQDFRLTKTWYDPAELTSSIYFLGNMILGQVYCVTADRIGRRPVLIFALVISGAAGVLSAFSPNFFLLLAARFLQGSCFSAITTINYVLCCESVGLNSHAIASMMFGVFWVIGYCAITPIALLSNNWRELQFWVSLPSLLFGIYMFVTLPESFAYLVSSGNRENAEKWLEKARESSKEKIAADVPSAIAYEREMNGSQLGLLETFGHIFRNNDLRAYIFVQTILWLVDLMIYTSLSLSGGDIGGGNKHFSFIFSGLVELPCYFFLPYFLDKYGRKPTVIGTHILASISMILMIFLDESEHGWLWIAIWLSAKFALSCGFMCCFVYGAEIFPTEFRNICLGFCGVVSNAGAMFSPHCYLLNSLFDGCMFATFSALCALCAVITVRLPETKHHNH